MLLDHRQVDQREQDVVVCGDQVGAWSYGAMVWLGLGMSAIAFVAVPICGLWLAVGYWLGRRQESLARTQARGDVAAPPAAVAATST